jgi:hypothetical protein
MRTDLDRLVADMKFSGTQSGAKATPVHHPKLGLDPLDQGSCPMELVHVQARVLCEQLLCRRNVDV